MQAAARTVGEYMAGLSANEREPLERLRALIREAVPEAAESMGYKMPTYTVNGQYLAALAAQKNHLSLYFCNVLLVDQHAPQFEKASLGRGCIRFKGIDQMPLPVVRRMLQLEAQRIQGQSIEYAKDAHGYYFPALLKKLGYQPGETVHLIQAPEWFRSGLKTAGVRPVRGRQCDWLHTFYTERQALQKLAGRLGACRRNTKMQMEDTTSCGRFFTERYILCRAASDLHFSDRLLDDYEVKRAIWVSWPKKAAKVPTNIVEDTLREVLLPTGWVDIKVIAVDQTWSGLKFARRQTKPRRGG